MLLTITSEAERATDLGYLLHKNPANVFQATTSFGRVLVFYPEATERRCTAALLLEVDPVGLVRGRGSTLDQYVNDRPYVASSLMSVAIGEAYRTALGGRCAKLPDRVDEAMPLTAELAAVSCSAGEPLIRKLFEPLGYAVQVTRHSLDGRFPRWGEGSLYTVLLSGTLTVQALLSHLYVLIPVLDNAKHYLIDETEVEKLLRRGEGWLSAHPEKELIAARYLKYRRQYVAAALEQLREESPVANEEEQEREEASVEAPMRLNDARTQAVLAAVRGMAPAAKRVLDLGCGEGRVLRVLLNDHGIGEIVGVDVSTLSLQIAERRLERLPERQRARARLVQGSALYADERFRGFDAALLVEVLEHIEPGRIGDVERVLFGQARPRRAVVTTPNREYNATWPSLEAGALRHRDHRFEWTRAEFREWATRVAGENGYAVQFQGIGPEDPELGCPTQMAVFDDERS